MKTTIIIPGKIQSTQPKPSKSQMIEALLEQARKEHAELVQRNIAKQDELRVQLKKEALKLFKKHELDEMDFDEKYYGDADKVELSLLVSSPEVRKLKAQMKNLMTHRFDIDEAKKKIREGLTPANPLLNNPDMEVPLTQLLARIMGTKTIEV